VSLVERSFGDLVALVPRGVEGVVFTTRAGGASTGPFASLNLGYSTGDAPGAVVTNRRALSRALGIPSRWATVHQVHGADVVVAGRGDAGEGVPGCRADGIVTPEAGLPVVALAADCVPIALVGPSLSGVVHAGWRGLASGAVASGVRAAGGHGVHAWVGPCIGPCHYEVGPEVVEAVARCVRDARSFTTTAGGRARLDLRAAARRLLEEAGATVADADDPPCTWCDPRFFSHRRDAGVTGRQAVVVWRHPGGG
jgi:polyphenol oxidase